jgi:hypothetical protein
MITNDSFSENTMVCPSTFPATRKGYNSYLRSIDIDPKDKIKVVLAITFKQFISVERHTMDEQISYASSMCEKYHEEYQKYTQAKMPQHASLASSNWDYWSNKLVELVSIKHPSDKK